jgi:aspartyl/asparaginyl beta-hydroxylase (cupin superfamily)
MLHRMVSAKARPDYFVDIVWDDGSKSAVSFADLVGRGVCAAMADTKYFVERMGIADEGYALAWPDEIEFSADSLWYKAHPDDARRDFDAAE